MPKLPLLHNLGLIPVQFEGFTEIKPKDEHAIEEAFAAAVESSHRFRLTDQDLVRDLWSTVPGRAKLRDDYEIHAYLSLTLRKIDDTLSMVGRLLGPNLETHLLETETFDPEILHETRLPLLRSSIQDLVYRLINLLPIDATVTSVQGAYVTLSGGEEQGIESGESLDIVRVAPKSVHPATGAWIDFKKERLGTVKVIDVKETATIGRITRQFPARQIEVGDGVKLRRLASRANYASMQSVNNLEENRPNAVVLVPAVPLGASPPIPRSTKLADDPGPKRPKESSVAMNPAAPESPQTKGEEEPPADTIPSSEDSDPSKGPSVWDEFAQETTSQKLLETARIAVGPTWWSIRGPVNSSGQFPIWLLNSISVGISRTMFYRIKADFGGGGLFGGTPAGRYLGYEGYGRLYWESPLTISMLRLWRAGGVASMSGISTSSGQYGGEDAVRGGIFGALGGLMVFGDDGKRYDWLAQYTLAPLNIGRVGYAGSFKTIESAMGWRLDLTVTESLAVGPVRWGGGLTYGDERKTLNNGRRFHSQDYSLKVLALYNF